jgi:type IV pilus assembly protein PilX
VNHFHNLNPCTQPAGRRSAQRGVSLLFALMALAAMMLAAVALVRSVDTGALVLGNLGFKQEATQAADRAAEVARTWLMTTAVDLTQDSPANGYYATSQDNLDPTGRVTTAATPLAVVNWGDSDSCACMTTSPATCSSCSRTPATCGTGAAACGTQVAARFLITRLCPLTGAAGSGANNCAKPASSGTADAAYRGEIRVGAGAPKPEAATSPYFRIVVRTVGGRGAVSFTETVVH